MRTAVIGSPTMSLGILGMGADSFAVRAEPDLVYGRAGEVELRLDLFRPEGAEGLRPGVVFVHGGGWKNGNRGQFGWHAEQLARRGYVAISASYRLTDVAPYPACLDDCQRAVRWLRARADEFQLDPARIGAFGSSAGGHLVACLGVRETLHDDDPDLAGIPSRVQAVVDYHGVHDFPPLEGDFAITADALYPLFGGPLASQRELWEDASPTRFADGNSAAMLLFHDPGDVTVPYEQSVDLALALIEAQRPVQFIPVPGAGHGFGYSPESRWQQRTWPVAVEWLDRHLAPGVDSTHP